MESPRFLCGQCNAGYKNKSSLRRHINVVHNQKRFVCNICSKDYSRNVDYIKHIVKMHQPIIMQQNQNNITNTPTTSNHKTDTPQHSIENTTAVLEGTTNWMDILKMSWQQAVMRKKRDNPHPHQNPNQDKYT